MAMQLSEHMQLSEQEWRQRLTPEQFAVLRNKATETPFTGKLLHNSKNGTYTCAACNHPLFSSDTKFESGSGWPSFYDVIEKGAVKFAPDHSHGMDRTEILCANCGSHLGHVFPMPELPTNTYFCVNSTALDFDEKGNSPHKGDTARPH